MASDTPPTHQTEKSGEATGQDSTYAEAYQRGLMDAHKPLTPSTSEAMTIAEAMAVALTPEGRTQMTCGEVVDIRNRFAAIIQKAIDGAAGQGGWRPIAEAKKDEAYTYIDIYARKPVGRGKFHGKRFPNCFWGAGQWLGLQSGYTAAYFMRPPEPPRPEET